MRFLFCCNTLHGFCNFRLDVVRHLAEKGNEILIVYPHLDGDDLLIAGLPKGCNAVKCSMSPTGKNLFRDIKLFVELRRIIERHKPDIVFNYTIKPNIYGGLASAMIGVPSVAVVPGLGYSFTNRGVFCSLLRKFYVWSLKKASCVVTLNKSDQKALKKQGIEDVVLFDGGEGVNLERFTFSEGDFSFPRFLMVARLLYDKGYSEFVVAAKAVKANYPEVQFDIAGTLNESNPSGVPESVVRNDEASGFIRYLGYVEDIGGQLSDPNTVVVLPSYYREGMNRSLMEACACGRPVITTSLPGLREIVEDGVNGFLVKPKDEDDLIKAIVSFLQLPVDKRRQMGLESRKLAEDRFDVRRVLSSYEAIIKKIIEDDV